MYNYNIKYYVFLRNILNHGFEPIFKANFLIFYCDLFLHIIRNIVYKNDKITVVNFRYFTFNI